MQQRTADTWEAPSMRRRRERLEAEAAARGRHEQSIIDRFKVMGIPEVMSHLAREMNPALYVLAGRAFGYKPSWASCRLRGDLAVACSVAPRRVLPMPESISWSDGKVIHLTRRLP